MYLIIIYMMKNVKNIYILDCVNHAKKNDLENNLDQWKCKNRYLNSGNAIRK
jgi:hypothetical protein